MPGRRLELGFAPGDSIGDAYWYQWNGMFWARELLSVARKSHTLVVSEFDADGHQGILRIGRAKRVLRRAVGSEEIPWAF